MSGKVIITLWSGAKSVIFPHKFFPSAKGWQMTACVCKTNQLMHFSMKDIKKWTDVLSESSQTPDQDDSVVMKGGMYVYTFPEDY